ncbi:hypothetical protein [Staphylococcus pseudintermedius]|uniref:hypothetical protein n=1 Tax=Staphylococcus pseudintermedius TaxID=283734 RepID=UPI0036F24F23
MGRYWEIGPSQSLYIPKAFLKQGQNEIIVFDSEGKYSESIQLIKTPKFSEV